MDNDQKGDNKAKKTWMMNDDLKGDNKDQYTDKDQTVIKKDQYTDKDHTVITKINGNK